MPTPRSLNRDVANARLWIGRVYHKWPYNDWLNQVHALTWRPLAYSIAQAYADTKKSE